MDIALAVEERYRATRTLSRFLRQRGEMPLGDTPLFLSPTRHGVLLTKITFPGTPRNRSIHKLMRPTAHCSLPLLLGKNAPFSFTRRRETGVAVASALFCLHIHRLRLRQLGPQAVRSDVGRFTRVPQCVFNNGLVFAFAKDDPD